MKSQFTTSRRRGFALVAILLAFALVTAACSQDSGSDEAATTTAASTETTEAVSAAPAPFSEGAVKVAIVQNSGAGDYFQQWTNGARQQAESVGMEIQLYDAQADNAKQATDMETAIGTDVVGIIVDHGQTDTMCPLINDALDAGKFVVIYDIAISECAPRAVQTQQSDASLADLVLGQMLDDVSSDQMVGYVNVLGIAPLDRRHVIWEEYVADNAWSQEFFVGEFTNSVATDNAQLVDAALKANPGVVAIFAPYDEFTKGTVSAIFENSLEASVAAYGIDISNADIEVMTAENSPWKATATTDPNAIGAAVVRVMALEIAGQNADRSVDFPGVLVTQTFLVDNEIRNMVDLRANMPELNLTEIKSAEWIPVINF
jgi:simple sugar transport system substrate-binding protein